MSERAQAPSFGPTALMRVLIAFDKFKGALSAREAGSIAQSALAEAQPTWICDVCPLTDGGEGFVEVLTDAAGGTRETVTVAGPLGAPIAAVLGKVIWAHIPDAARRWLQRENPPAASLRPEAPVYVIEMSAASGLALLRDSERDPWLATTQGTGELLEHAYRAGAAVIVLGLGGSATNDVGLGALKALGLQFWEGNGTEITLPSPARWTHLTGIRGSAPRDFPPLYLACDVTNPLLGAHGATATYGPQKGLALGDVAQLDLAAARVAKLLAEHFHKSFSLAEEPGAGAAGGIAFGLNVALDAQRVPGFALVSTWTNFSERMQAADFAITGEGRYDATSSSGKAAGAVVQSAVTARKPVHIFAGQVDAAPRAGVHPHEISPREWALADALQATATNLRQHILATFSQG